MKKIIYSIVTASILCAFLTLIFPTWFLKEDTWWTSLGDTARVDIAFVGNLKNGRVKVEGGSNAKVIQPKWLSASSENSFQGTVVEFPVSYRTKSYRIKLTPQADEWGKDAALTIKFRGEDLKYEGKRKPAWVSLQNISLNGQPVATEKVVWHDQPFTLQHSPLASEITLTFDAHKPSIMTGISLTNLLVTFFAFLMLCLFAVPLKRAVSRVLKPFDGKDIAQTLAAGYAHIDPVYRRSFWIILGVLCFAFGFHAIQFMWGNDDWQLQTQNQRWLAREGSGRYMIYSIKVLFSNGIYLPLIYDLIAFVASALNAVLLCKYWHLEKRVIYYVICGLVLTAQPFALGMAWCMHMFPEVVIGVTCALVALILAENIATRKESLFKKLTYSLVGIVLVNFSLAIYPVLITTIAVAFSGRLLVLSFDWDGSRQRLKSYLKAFMISATIIVLGIVSYKLIIAFVFPVQNSYNTGTLPLEQVPERLGVLFRQSFRQLYRYNHPFIPQWTLWVFLGFTLVLILHICTSQGLKQKVVRLFFLFGSLFATQTAMIIARTHVIADRVELFGLVVFEALVMAVVFTRIRKLHNLSVIAGACVIFASVIQDLDCLRVWKLGFDAEKMLWNRILARMEVQKDFDPNKKYDVLQIGYPVFGLSKNFYVGTYKPGPPRGRYFVLCSFDREHYPFLAHETYYPTRFRRKGLSSVSKNDYYLAQLKRLYAAGVLQKAEVWPGANGLIVWKDIILFVTDGKELENYKKLFERELGGK